MMLSRYNTQELIEEIRLRDDQTEYTYDDYMVKGGGTLQPNQYTDETLESIIESNLKDMSMKTFIEALGITTVDNRTVVMLGETAVSLAIQGKKVVPNIAGIPLDGRKRAVIFKMLIQHSPKVSTYQSRSDYTHLMSNDETVFDIYVIQLNNRTYDIGFIHTEDVMTHNVKANVGANYMRVHSDYHKPDDLDSIKVYVHDKNHYTPLDKSEDMYGWKGSNSLAEFQEDQLKDVLDMALDGGRIDYDQYASIMTLDNRDIVRTHNVKDNTDNMTNDPIKDILTDMALKLAIRPDMDIVDEYTSILNSILKD